ncbi:DapH/DapD/GlmU-related protein [Reichenbachiella sp. MSK19-1]|uniref:DapH/DapD/GlmU-related protein n=1 Tax=Reichenbachiella sp. MSK19-1 TaxID=1897631 RepID=UPI000E6B800B|nr:DapH/DapD/GlmU-related protein [Reichenbachiella sp. MSK19-1]RJE70872.1 hypothetical protein BGP76_08800 [Reichenbachiella sp. MSK19-1]
MKQKTRTLLSKILFKLRFILLEVIQHAEKEQIATKNEILLSKILTKGKGIRFNGSITITHPRLITLGSNVHIGNNAYIHSDGGVIIGDNTHISRNFVLYSSNHQYEGEALPYDNKRVYKPVHIEKNVWIGMNVCIIPGVTIGEGAIIGLGTVVTRDVPRLSIIGNPPERILKSRNETLYSNLENKKKYGGINGDLYNQSGRTVMEMEDNLFFIVGTGRSGSEAIAKTLNEHPDITCAHEPKGELIKLSTDYAHKLISKDEVKSRIIALYKSSSNIYTKIYGESDQKISNLVEIYAEIFPKAKFIWSIRESKKFIMSAYGRGWFDDREFEYPFREKLSVPSLFALPIYRENRINGGICDPRIDIEIWKKMSPFERNCWYWEYWNSLIEQQLETISNESISIKLESFNTNVLDILTFLDANDIRLKPKTTNIAAYPIQQNLTLEEEAHHNKWCLKKMNKWYGIK